MATAAKVKAISDKFVAQKKELTSKRDELRARFNEHRTGVIVDREPDDEGAEAIENYSKDFMVATLERERQTLQEINTALERMKTGQYGICDNCGAEIPAARLRALPWARYCLRCAEQMRAGG